MLVQHSHTHKLWKLVPDNYAAMEINGTPSVLFLLSPVSSEWEYVTVC
jgi:hypothetical protein